MFYRAYKELSEGQYQEVAEEQGAVEVEEVEEEQEAEEEQVPLPMHHNNQHNPRKTSK